MSGYLPTDIENQNRLWEIIDKKDDLILALKATLKMVEYSYPDRCCPVCGGHLHHASECTLAAMLYPEFERSHIRDTGDSAVNDMLFKIENDENYKFLLPEKWKPKEGSV